MSDVQPDARLGEDGAAERHESQGSRAEETPEETVRRVAREARQRGEREEGDFPLNVGGAT